MYSCAKKHFFFTNPLIRVPVLRASLTLEKLKEKQIHLIFSDKFNTQHETLEMLYIEWV